jgi:hypothetical protein
MRIGEKGILMFFMLFSLSTSYSYLKNESKQKEESNLDSEASCLPALSNTFNLLVILFFIFINCSLIMITDTSLKYSSTLKIWYWIYFCIITWSKITLKFSWSLLLLIKVYFSHEIIDLMNELKLKQIYHDTIYILKDFSFIAQ